MNVGLVMEMPEANLKNLWYGIYVDSRQIPLIIKKEILCKHTRWLSVR